MSGSAIPQRSGGDTVEAGIKVGQLSSTGGYKGEFNNDDQSHADFCVKLKKPVVALRYADGTPSGFTLTKDILIPQPGSGVWCPEPGMARLDAREFVTAGNGSKMLFHRGGWGFAGNDPASAVHYGHILASDIDSVGLKFVRSDSVPRLPGTPRGRWVTAPTQPWPGKRTAEWQRESLSRTLSGAVHCFGAPDTARYEVPKHSANRCEPIRHLW